MIDKEIIEIKEICSTQFNFFNHSKNDNKISQKLKFKFNFEWFIFIFEVTNEKNRKDFYFEFTNIKRKNIFIFIEYKFIFYICKIRNYYNKIKNNINIYIFKLIFKYLYIKSKKDKYSKYFIYMRLL